MPHAAPPPPHFSFLLPPPLLPSPPWSMWKRSRFELASVRILPLSLSLSLSPSLSLSLSLSSLTTLWRKRETFIWGYQVGEERERERWREGRRERRRERDERDLANRSDLCATPRRAGSERRKGSKTCLDLT
ncbi:hypothetical protein IE53DRAFT_124969 [Violaceomyces palustris]|uniref:Uncharacterized protein n=1 Tax=Violaceomyces palustris TaxID=1673888 RepID=A0ACD0NVE7_9BASI|nr:hypothetical protein IE53DRAFT_124969 [Violaceomyces palustris]